MNPHKNSFQRQFNASLTLLVLSIVFASAKADPVSTTPGIIDFPAEAPTGLALYPVESTADWQIEGDAPVTGARLDFSSTDGQFHVDYSYYSKQTAKFSSYPIDEFIYIIEGQVEMINTDGVGKLYGPGDMFLIPKGFQGTWRQLTPVKKIAVIHGDYIFAAE